MNIKKTKVALALGGLIFLAVPLSSVFADQKHNEMKEMQMDDSIPLIKNELRGYVEGVKNNDTQKMQQHLNELLTLSEMPAMDHSTMDHSEMKMDHASMENGTMPAMDHSAMDDSEMKMDHAGMENGTMPAMDHGMSSMEGMSAAQHQHMIYMQQIAGLNDLFKQLNKTQDKAEIKLILAKIKDQLKKNQ
jgi:hypothetical protein